MAYFDPSAESTIRNLGQTFLCGNQDADGNVGSTVTAPPTAFQALEDPSAFVAYCFTDPAGVPLRQAPLHRDLQQFLTRHRKALIELPRDHGKSVQICARAIWE